MHGLFGRRARGEARVHEAARLTRGFAVGGPAAFRKVFQQGKNNVCVRLVNTANVVFFGRVGEALVECQAGIKAAEIAPLNFCGKGKSHVGNKPAR